MANNGSGQNIGSVLSRAAGAGVSAIPGGIEQEKQQKLQTLTMALDLKNNLLAQQQGAMNLQLGQKKLELADLNIKQALIEASTYRTPEQITQDELAKARGIADINLEESKKLYDYQQSQANVARNNLLDTLVPYDLSKNLGPVQVDEATKRQVQIQEVADKYPGINIPGIGSISSTKDNGLNASKLQSNETQRYMQVVNTITSRINDIDQMLGIQGFGSDEQRAQLQQERDNLGALYKQALNKLVESNDITAQPPNNSDFGDIPTDVLQMFMDQNEI